ncbi:sugar transporter [Neorhizobium lilium]|uniref:Sugar transporter n=1 Tax=Neorhizobium lilium TaxID=2503024 RepID=A0A444LKP3_9HYPH|nr:oligosaccharide flippase family protein [Neorhizobium lilium]RWX80899.1 sugar transporter [Neorhizobium lilium]
MSTPRRAFIMSSIEQYLAMVINVSVIATMARILTPDEVGHAVTGIGIGAIALSLREFVTPEFLIQKKDIDRQDLSTSFTLLSGITIFVGLAVFAVSGEISRLYGSPELVLFLLLFLLSAVAETISLPVIAVLRRNMSFGALANMRTVALIVYAVVTITLGFLGFGFVSYAWGTLANAMVLACMTAYAAPYPISSMCRISVAGWRNVVAFGRFKGASQAIDRIYETVPQLILGKIISMSSVGLYNRANTICSIPDRLIMSAFYAMAFPALAAGVRDGRDIKQAYLDTLSYLSGIYWPGVLLIALTAEPIVNLVLGPQWHEAILIVRLLAGAAVFWFAVIGINPLLLALGQNRDAFLSSFICRSIAAALLCTASLHGILAMALSQFVAMPAQMIISLYFARRHLRFTFAELWGAIAPSMLVTSCSMAGPLAMLVANHGNADTNLPQLAATLVLAAAGWFPGLMLANHPLLVEVRLVFKTLLSLAPWLRRNSATTG